MNPLKDIQNKLNPMSFAESMYLIEGKPMRFTEGRNYLKAIHNADIPQALLMTGRQVEKTTSVSIKISNNVLLKPFSRSLYVAPMNEQVKTFSRGRLDKLFRYSQKDLIRRRYMNSELTNQVFHKEFINGSEIYLRNCYEEADNIRGLSIDDIFIDEVQDIMVDALPVIRETQTRSKNPHFFLTGTPKTFSNTIQQMWDGASQADWVIVCPACRKHQILGVANVTPKGFICRNTRCGKPLPDLARAMGRWEHRKPDARMKSFRITQMMVPDINPASIFEKIENYPKVKLYNEVLGKSYENADKPFSDKLLSEMTDDTISLYVRLQGIMSEFANLPTYMGIDWGEGEKSGQQGTGYTVISIFGFNRVGKFQQIAVKRFERGDELDPDYQIKFILDWMVQFRISMCVADYGAGQKENMRLKKELGVRFFQCQYVGRQKLKLAFEPETFKYKIPRSRWLTDFIEFVQQGNLVFAGKNNPNLEWLYDNFRSIYAEYRSSYAGLSEELYYGHSSSEPDDGLHSTFYAWFASQIHKGGISTRQSSGSIFRGTNGR
jgi:hypothetical protein